MRAWWRARRTRTKVVLIVVGLLLLAGAANGGSKPTTLKPAASAKTTPAVAAASADVATVAPTATDSGAANVPTNVRAATTAPSAAATSTTAPASTSSCQLRGPLPDPVCTPGATDPRVTQANIHSTICVSGYTTTVRPPTSYTNPLEVQLIAKYGLNLTPQQTELDHLIALELGGHPTDVRNLFPEPYLPTPGAHEKDNLENKLHAMVCAGQIDLATAQNAIATDWLAAYHRYVAP